MADSHPNPAPSGSTGFSPIALQAILAALEAPLASDAGEDIQLLARHLHTLKSDQASSLQCAKILDRLYTRTIRVVNGLRPVLAEQPFPIPRRIRQLIRSTQDLLERLGEDLLAVQNKVNEQQPHSLRQQIDQILWRHLNTLRLHLLVGDLAATPPAIGIWQQLHRTYTNATRLGIAEHAPKGMPCSLQNLYYSAVLLGCAQPASFTSREIHFVADYLDQFSDQIDPGNKAHPESPAAFWIDPLRDAPATACARKKAPPETPAVFFSCDRIVSLLKNQLSSLEAGILPSQIGLPDFATTHAGRGVMRRLIAYWGEPGKRRFPRRRQNARAAICCGLENLWQLFRNEEKASVDASSWMITNESPDGYALMHVAGKTGNLCVGDIAAIRPENAELWQIGIVRWALSENQEHIELGLQIMARRAVSALLAMPAKKGQPERKPRPVLILPETPPLHPLEMLVAPSEAIGRQEQKLVLLLEKGNFEVREVCATRLEEQNSQIEVFSIESLPTAV